jgi:hypothetical protein
MSAQLSFEIMVHEAVPNAEEIGSTEPYIYPVPQKIQRLNVFCPNEVLVQVVKKMMRSWRPQVSDAPCHLREEGIFTVCGTS